MSDILREFIKQGSKGKDEKEWIQNIASKVNRCCLATHISGFTHSGTKIAILAENKSLKSLGYVVTEWEKDEYDVLPLGGAADSPIAKFLKLELEDTRNMVFHILDQDQSVESCLESYDVDIKKLYSDIKEIVNDFKPIALDASDGRMRQVYFPIDSHEYSLLTVMPSSLQLIMLKEKLREIRSASFEKADEEGEYILPIEGITKIKVGGAQPQNISLLNSRAGGDYFLLNSIPPHISYRRIRYPKVDFFRESLYSIKDDNLIRSYHKLKSISNSNIRIRNTIEKLIEQIIDLVFQHLYTLRDNISDEPYEIEFLSLPKCQRLWILGKEDLSEEEKENLSYQFGRWFRDRYRKIMGADSLVLNDDDIKEFANLFYTVLDGGI